MCSPSKSEINNLTKCHRTYVSLKRSAFICRDFFKWSLLTMMVNVHMNRSSLTHRRVVLIKIFSFIQGIQSIKSALVIDFRASIKKQVNFYMNVGQFFSQMKRRLEKTQMQFYKRILRIPWTEHVSNREVLRKMRTKSTYT